jgi:uncharacterized protein (DUF4415 family)
MPKATKKPTTRARAKGAPTSNLTARQSRELAAIAALADEQIDTSDIPELSPAAWKDAVRGKFYRPMKQAVSMRLDADVVAWLKKPGKGYQTRANRILRQHMLHDTRRA